MTQVKFDTYPIGKEGNSVSVSHVKDDWYTLDISDHYDQNTIEFFVHRDDIKGLADFLQKCLET